MHVTIYKKCEIQLNEWEEFYADCLTVCNHITASIYGRLTHIWDKVDYHTWIDLLPG